MLLIAGNAQHLGSLDDLDALAAMRFTERLLVVVEAMPTVEVGEFDAASVEQLGNR
jgi:hypothetical protein